MVEVGATGAEFESAGAGAAEGAALVSIAGAALVSVPAPPSVEEELEGSAR